MSKNYFRSQLRRLGKAKEKSRVRSVPTLSPETTPSASPVHTQITKHESNYSLTSIASGSSYGNPVLTHLEEPLERKEVIGITGDVQKFVAAISELRKAMEEADEAIEEDDSSSQESIERDTNSQSDAEAAILVHLKDLVQLVRNCLDHYHGMQSTEVKNATTQLMSSLMTCEHMSASQCPSCNSAIDVLVDAFTNSVQVFLSGDSHEVLPLPHKKFHGSTNMLKGFSKSYEHLASRYGSSVDLSQQANEPIVDDIDQALASTENGVDVAAKYIKMRTKYHREVTTYLLKRGQIEMRYNHEMLKLAKKTHSAVKELQQQEECLPLADLFLESIDQDMRFAANCNATFNIQVGGEVIEPLEQKMAENERAKKDLTHTWQKELKKLTDAKAAMKNARAKYQFMGQDLARVKSLLSAEPHGKQADKRKKELADLEAKWQETEAAYKGAVDLCNSCQYQVHKSAQQSILCAYRRLVLDFDRSLRSKLEVYFQLQHNVFFPIPDVMDSFLTTVQDYEIGYDFMEYIKKHPKMRKEPEDYLFEEFDPVEEESDYESLQHLGNFRTRSSSSSDTVYSAPPLNHDPSHRMPSPQLCHGFASGHSEATARNFQQAGTMEGDHTLVNSMAFLLEASTDYIKPSTNRRSSEQPLPLSRYSSILNSKGEQEVLMSKNALTHTFKRLHAPSRCRECDNFVYFNGYECEMCGLASHKKCLAPLSIRCGSKPLDRKLTTFGVDILRHLEVSKTNIPIIVTKCIKEIEERGLDTHGLYRISTTKTKLEHLCQLFESGADRVDLSDRQPHLIASCLKLYFRQLPEPIFTFSLYEDMISFAREASHTLPCNISTNSEAAKQTAFVELERLKKLLSCLDHQRYLTLARLFYHLHRVASAPHVKNNAMPASNLGIVFGPTLLRRRDNVASLTLLADMTAQAKTIEILISHVHEETASYSPAECLWSAESLQAFPDVFTVSEEEVLQIEGVDPDEGHVEERLVDGIMNTSESLGKQDENDPDDGFTRNPYRTPLGTPPQRRRENISELGDVLETLQGAFPRRQSLPTYKLIAHSEPEGHRPYQCLTHTSTCQENALRHQLCQGASGFLEHSKTLTPMHEVVRKHSWDDNSHERIPKMKVSQMSQSTPGLSNLHTVGKLEVSGSEKDGFGIEAALLTDDLRKCIPSSSSAANMTVDQPDIVLRENRERELFQENSKRNSDNLSNELQDLLHQRDNVPYLSSSIETTPERTSTEQACDYTFQGESEVEYKSQNLRLWDILSPGSPSYPSLSDTHHLKTQHIYEYSTQSVHILDSSQSQNNRQAHPGTSPNLQTSTMIDHFSPIFLHSQSGQDNTAKENIALKPDVSDDKKQSLHSTQSRHSNTPQNELSPILRPLHIVEQATDEVVTTFDYDSDESNHALQTSFDDSSLPTVVSKEDVGKHGSVSPWHDKTRKIRINPPRVLKVSTQLPTTSERNLVRHSTPVDRTTKKGGDKLTQSRSCSEMNPQESPDTESALLHASQPSQVSHNSSIDTASERVLEKY